MSVDPRLLRAINELRLAVGGVASMANTAALGLPVGHILSQVDHHLHQVGELLDELEE